MNTLARGLERARVRRVRRMKEREINARAKLESGESQQRAWAGKHMPVKEVIEDWHTDAQGNRCRTVGNAE